MLNELFQIFQAFEQYERANSNHWAYNVIGQNGKPARTALENYKRSKADAPAALDKQLHFMEYLNHRRDLLDALMQSVIDTSGELIQASVERAANDAARQMADKAVKFYFK